MNHSDEPSNYESLVRTLVQEGSNGSKRANDAMTSLIKQFTPTLRAVMYHRGVKEADIDDLLQEIFLRAFRKIHQLNDPSRLHSWMISIAVRLSINHHVRKKMTRSLDGVIEDCGIPVELQSDVDEVLEKIINNEDILLLQRTIPTLRPIDRDVLEAFYFDGLSLQEMHELSNSEEKRTPIGTFKRRLHTARGRLHEKLSPLLSEE